MKATLSYVEQFRVHQKFVQAHLNGSEQPLPPAFFPPSSYWTSYEKDLFFHGLALYSRFRPDLIAESIKTKTTLDVCLYLDVLQTASSRMIPSEIHDGSFRSSLEPAMEVSSTWIQNEEQIALEMIVREAQLGEVDSATVPLSPTSGVLPSVKSSNPADFFRLASLARLMRLHGSLNDSSYGVSISPDTMQLLIIILEEFISKVVHGSLISKEQEIRLKGALKVWKYDQKEISAENVKETLKSMGIAHSNLKDCLAEVVGEGSDDASSPDPSIGTEMETNDDNNDDDDQDDEEDETSSEDTVIDPSNASDASEQSAEPSQASTEFWLPQSLRRCLLPKDFGVSENEGDILREIDEIGLQRELKEEEELDTRDLLASKEFEAGLWGL